MKYAAIFQSLKSVNRYANAYVSNACPPICQSACKVRPVESGLPGGTSGFSSGPREAKTEETPCRAVQCGPKAVAYRNKQDIDMTQARRARKARAHVGQVLRLSAALAAVATTTAHADPPSLATRRAAVESTLAHASSCQHLGEYYWEIGDASGVRMHGQHGCLLYTSDAADEHRDV